MEINEIKMLVSIICSVLVLLIGYLFGSISGGILIGKLFKKDDPRNAGSKNSGGTNASRLWGFKIGALVYLFDFMKMALPLWALWAICTFIPINGYTIIPTASDIYAGNFQTAYMEWPVYWLAIIGCSIGHCWPIFHKFKGGKAAACTYASCMFTSWFTALSSMTTFATTVLTTKYVSLGSILGSIVGSICAWLTCIDGFRQFAMYGNTLCGHWVFGLCVTISTLILIYRHRANIQRLIAGNERKVHF